MIPFFVLDRPVSLEILKDFFANNLDYQFGILTHAFTSKKFKEKFKKFPYETPLKYSKLNDSYSLNKKIANSIIKFVDSGIFQAKRNITYEELFEVYEYLNADYGIIIDFLKDRKKTVESAKEAKKVYEKSNYKFKLVGVAQGENIQDYLKCYQDLKNLGYKYIAIGGLLKRNGNSNYIRLSCEVFLIDLLEKINQEFKPVWIFTLGIYNPERHKLLEDYGVWGADYKGWLFEYEEDYSFIKEYIDLYNVSEKMKNKIKKALDIYAGLKKFKSLTSKELEKNDINKKLLKLKKTIDNMLKKENLSLQQFRFLRVQENLKRKIIEKNFQHLNPVISESSSLKS